jgi:hypothetical protein
MVGPTYFGLLAEFGAAEIPLVDCCEKYFGLGSDQAKRLAAKYSLPVPAYRAVRSQKGKWVISADVLANHRDKTKAEHGRLFQAMSSNAAT